MRTFSLKHEQSDFENKARVLVDGVETPLAFNFDPSMFEVYKIMKSEFVKIVLEDTNKWFTTGGNPLTEEEQKQIKSLVNKEICGKMPC